MEKAPQRRTIEVAEDRDILKAKLDEYRKRLETMKSPPAQLDTRYKIAVLEPLLESGVVDRAQVGEALHAAFGEVNESLLDNAWSVIDDYARHGGLGLVGGTGLPRRQPADNMPE
jgi:hypothetical protein